MRMFDLIEKKKNNEELLDSEIEFIIEGYVKDKIPDYQISALLMAICFNGLNERELKSLTLSMAHSGHMIDLSVIDGPTVDKHSTGGVGDKTSLVLTPLVSACGAKVAKMSGRGLGHTGGTLDKLASITGYDYNVDEESFIKQVQDIGIAIIGQSDNLVPADQKLYALRDVTATVNCVGLIASSIMSKKIASGADNILLDVKYGNGAFMQTKEEAHLLAKTMIKIGKSLNKNTGATISNMEQPLGNAIGNSLEIIEVINTLKGKGPKDLEELCLQEGAHILLQAGICNDETEAYKLLQETIKNNKGFEKFKELIAYQGGDTKLLDNPELFDQAQYQEEIKSLKTGYIKTLKAKDLGIVAMKLGGGRLKKNDDIDCSVGLVLNKKIGDYVEKDELLVKVYSNEPLNEEIIEEIYKAYDIIVDKVEKPKLIEEVL